jgi:DNA repair protein RadC
MNDEPATESTMGEAIRPSLPSGVRKTGRREYRVGILRVRLVRDSSIPGQRCISGPADAARIASTYLDGADREHFVTLLLNTRHEVLGMNTVSIGGLASAPVHPREVYKAAILAGAASVLCIHNHPSGHVEPSRDDLALTSQLIAAGRLLGIEVLDHIILGADGRYASLRERGEFR